MRSRSDERRVVTVLFADLVGFTTWSESLDPEQVKALVDRAFERLVRDVTAFGGRVDKIVGDAILALFGAPTAHEDDAERAVRAALRMQESLQKYATEIDMDIRMRVGVNTGEVLVGGLRAGGDYTAMGDVVNTASRLQAAADPSTVLVGEATYHVTRDAIAYEPRGSLIPRGREQPVRVWSATGTIRPPGYRTRRSATPLIGREAEMSAVGNTVELSIRNSRAQVVLLLGEAGIGKSRLAEEIPAMAAGERGDVVVMAGRCVPYGEANPWWPVGAALRDGLGVDLEDSLPEARAKTSDAVERSLGDESLLPSVVNGLLHLMGYEGPLRGLDPGRARAEASQALLTYLESLVAEHPVVVRIADLHWADDLVLETLDDLVGQLARSSLVVVGTARRSLLRRWTPRAGRHNTLVLNVDPLDQASAAALLDSLVDRDLPDDLRDTLLDRAGGNPFFLEELVSLLVSDSPELPSAVELPDTLRGLIAARIDGLAPDEQTVLEDAAVWGSSGPYEALSKISLAMRGQDDVHDVLASLERKEILTLDADDWTFRSDLVREVAYARLTKLDRLRRHHGIASYMEAVSGGRFVDDGFVDTVSRHYTEAARLSIELGPVARIPDDVVARAVHWLSEAARRAEHTAAWPLATRHYSHALELTDGEGDRDARIGLLLGRSHAWCEQWQFDGARDDARVALQLAEDAGDGATRARALLSLGEVETRDGRLEEAQGLLADAIAGFEACGDVHGRAEALRLTGMAALFHQDHDGAREPIEEALTAFRQVGDRRGEAWALQNLAWIAFASGRVAEAESRLGEAAATFTEVGDSGGLTWTFGLLAFVRFYEGRLDDAVDLATQVRRESERRGERWGEGMMMIILGSVELWAGRTTAAVETLQRSVAIFRQLSDTLGRVQALAALGRSLVMSGEVDRGLDALAEALRFDPSAPMLDDGGLVGLTSLLVRVQLGGVGLDPDGLDAALGHLSAATAEGRTPQLDLGVAAAVGLAQQGRLDEAASLLAEILGDGAPTASFAAARALVSAARRQVEHLAADVALVRSHPSATYLDRALAALAEGLASASGAHDQPAPNAVSSALASFDVARAEVDPTEDVLSAATVALAAAIAAESLGHADGEIRGAAAEAMWERLGIDPIGWRTLFSAAVGVPLAG
jgi:class 3 adenylate cyclase/tetratricopeptide (TPR) repeat protein